MRLHARRVLRQQPRTHQAGSGQGVERTVASMSTPLGIKPLYHFTCADGHRRIGRYNCLLMPQSMWPFVWLTTEPVPDFEATGLTSITLDCDRTQFRYVVTDVSVCRPWLGSPERGRVSRPFLCEMEEHGDPEHWWISTEPVRAEWDRTWQRQRAS